MMSQSYGISDRRHAAARIREKAKEKQDAMDKAVKSLVPSKKMLARGLVPTDSELQLLPASLRKQLEDKLSSTDAEQPKTIKELNTIIINWEHGRAWEIDREWLPEAAKHVLRASRNGILPFLSEDILSCYIPRDADDEDKWRDYWWEIVLKECKPFREYFPSEANSETDPWHRVKECIGCFKLWADLIEGKIKTTQPANGDSEKSASSESMPGAITREQETTLTPNDTSSPPSQPSPSTDTPPTVTYAVGIVLKMIEVHHDTLRKYAKLAGVKTPGRGKRNHRYSEHDVRKILQYIIDHTSEYAMKGRCQKALEKLSKIRL
ncbi:MAG: hypothetical protein FWD61_14110 [Phycisphaerales bacterium]|nr:hypothetical protein [Phycisphaerales bacterium]